MPSSCGEKEGPTVSGSSFFASKDLIYQDAAPLIKESGPVADIHMCALTHEPERIPFRMKRESFLLQNAISTVT